MQARIHLRMKAQGGTLGMSHGSLHMDPSLISVILPVSNQASQIGSTLRDYISEVVQLTTPFELLPVVHGQQRDDSLEICRSLSDADPRVRTLQVQTEGWGRAVQLGLRDCRGTVI